MKGWYTKEGMGVICADRNGYPNPDLPRASGYYLLAGSSHTEAVYLLPGQSYPEMVNRMMGDEELHVYSIAHGGFLFTDILGRLDGMAEEFPDAQGLIIETFTIDLDEDALEEIRDQKGPGETDPRTVFEYYDEGTRMRIELKRFLPLTAVWGVQWRALKQNSTAADPAGTVTEEEPDPQYADNIHQILQELSAYYDGNIIILYHPLVQLDGGYQIMQEQKTEVFRAACEEYGIVFLDLSDAFAEAYEEKRVIPYGFWNTSMGEGHMNAMGHAIAAERLYTELRERQEQP